jgi:general secretion pathway protein D
VGAATGITFLPSPQVRATVSLTLPAGSRPLTAQQFYAMFLSMLGQYGFVAVPAGNNTMKIVQENQARIMPGNDLPTGSNLAADEIVTDVLETKNINGLQVSTVLRTFIGNSGQIVPVPGTNTMIITDRAGNVARLKRILARVDQSSNSDIQMIPLENAVASEVSRLLTSLLAAQPADAGGGGVVPRVQADDRTNSIVVSGDPAQRLRISALAADLDAPVTNGGGTQVFSLKYATATDLAATLNQQVTGTTTTTGGGGGGAAAAGGPQAPSAAAIADRSVKIIAHEATNKLIITAPSRQMTAISSIIESLDMPPDQVHIEAIVAEISDRQAADLGVNWAVFSTDGNTNVPISGFISPIAGASIGEVAGAVVDIEGTIGNSALPQGATFGVGRLKDAGVSFAAMLRALNTNGITNIVSLPNVTATNNQEAEMKSGQKVPFLTNQVTNTGGGLGGNNGLALSNQVQRQDVGTTLKVTPQIISDNDEVILKIALTSSELSGQSGDAGSLITNERSVTTQVRVRSGSTIVIGGMIKNGTDESETRVPFLSKIPVLGELFRTRTGSKEKTNMMVFIQPRILRDAIQASAETAARANFLRETENEQKNKKKELLPLMPQDDRSMIPGMGLPPPAGTPAAPATGK